MAEERQIKVGQGVVFYDTDGASRDALVTCVWGPKCVNVVCICKDDESKDCNGRIPGDAFTSVPHVSNTGAHGYYFRLADEEPRPAQEPAEV